jgi:outer membrane protein TolC
MPIYEGQYALHARRSLLPQLGLVLLLAAFLPGRLFGQGSPGASPLSLRQAIDVALEKNPQRKAALADAQAASADVKQAKSSLYPHFTFSETATAGNDPVFVFGSKLRQQRFGAADFAPNVLNTPVPFGNYATRFGGAWNLFDSMASWRSITRAQRAEDAANQQLERADQEIVFRVIESYYSLLLAGKQAGVSEQALQTAQAILEQSENRVASGVVVESDSLTAKVRLAARKEELIRARNSVSLARAQLSAAMGLSTQETFEPSEALAERSLPSVLLEEFEKQAVERRPDLKRLRSAEEAQQESVSIAKSSFGPRVNAFADWEADNPTLVAGGGGNNWLAGIEVQFDLFTGGAKQAQLFRERETQKKIAAVRESATDTVRLEVRKAYYDLDSARQQLEVVRAAIAEAQESLRINRDRYDTGLSTVTDLLAAEDAARRTQADYWETLTRFYTGYAALELAGGTLNPQSLVVTP